MFLKNTENKNENAKLKEKNQNLIKCQEWNKQLNMIENDLELVRIMSSRAATFYLRLQSWKTASS